MDNLELFELSSPYPNFINMIKRIKKYNHIKKIPTAEWELRLELSPDDVITKNLNNITQSYHTTGIYDEIQVKIHYLSRNPG